MALRVVDFARRDRIGHGSGPNLGHLIQFASEANPLDFGTGRHGADDHGDVVILAFRIDHIGEKHRLAVFLLHTAPELPTHQGMDFGVLVYFHIDRYKRPGLFQAP